MKVNRVRQVQSLIRVQQRCFLDAFGLGKQAKEADIEARIDQTTKAYRYSGATIKDKRCSFDGEGRMLIYDAVPHSLKTHSNHSFRLLFSTSLLYLSYLSYTNSTFLAGITISPQSMYGIAGLGLLIGYSALTKYLQKQTLITRIFLLRGLDHIRLEDAVGNFADIPIDQFQLSSSNQYTAHLTVKILDIQYLEIYLKNASYFDPELLYALSSPKVARITLQQTSTA